MSEAGKLTAASRRIFSLSSSTTSGSCSHFTHFSKRALDLFRKSAYSAFYRVYQLTTDTCETNRQDMTSCNHLSDVITVFTCKMCPPDTFRPQFTLIAVSTTNFNQPYPLLPGLYYKTSLNQNQSENC